MGVVGAAVGRLRGVYPMVNCVMIPDANLHASKQKMNNVDPYPTHHVSLGPPVCVVVHRWDCGVEARRLLPGARAASVALGGRSGSAEVICTAEVGEYLLQFVRT